MQHLRSEVAEREEKGVNENGYTEKEQKIYDDALAEAQANRHPASFSVAARAVEKYREAVQTQGQVEPPAPDCPPKSGETRTVDPAPTPTWREPTDDELRNAKRLFNKFVTDVTFKRPTDERELYHHLPNVLKEKIDSVVDLKDYNHQQATIDKIFETDDGKYIAVMLSYFTKQQEMSLVMR